MPFLNFMPDAIAIIRFRFYIIQHSAVFLISLVNSTKLKICRVLVLAGLGRSQARESIQQYAAALGVCCVLDCIVQMERHLGRQQQHST